MNSQEFKELLEVLEIHAEKSKVTLKDINASFRKLVLKVHPDKVGDDRTAAFLKLKMAKMTG